MTGRERALQDIVRLTRENGIGLDEIAAALGRQQVEANKKDASTLTRVFSYLGGIFIFAGLSAYTAMVWDELNSAARIIITLGPGLVSLILAVAGAQQNRADRNVNALTVLSAIFQPAGLFVAVIEFSTGGGNPWLASLAIFGILAAQYGLLFFQLRRTALLFFAIYFATLAFISLCNFLNIPRELTEFICGVSLTALSYGIQRTPYNGICGFGYFVGSLTLLWMGFDWLQDTPFEILYLGVAGFMLYVSTIVRSRAMLVTATLALLSYISYFTQRYFLDSTGWPLFLVFMGLIFFGIGNLAVRLNRRLK